MRWMIIVAGLLLASACATEAEFRKLADSWIGTPEEDLVARWGTPDGFYESGGTRFLTYAESRTEYVPGTAPTYSTTMIGKTTYTTSSGGSSGYLYTSACSITFRIVDAKVESYSYKGNACRA